MRTTIRNLFALALTFTAALPLAACDADEMDAVLAAADDEVALRDGDLTNTPPEGDRPDHDIDDLAAGPDAGRDVIGGPGDIAGGFLPCDMEAQDCPTGHACILVADPQTEQMAPACVAIEATDDIAIKT